MTYQDFMHKLINIGIDAAKADYGPKKGQDAWDHGKHVSPWTTNGKFDDAKLAGAIDGFTECRGKTPEEIGELLKDANKNMQAAFVRVTEKEISSQEYWRLVCRRAEIEWVANCVSAMLSNQGLEPIIPFTARAVLMVAKIVGVKPE